MDSKRLNYNNYSYSDKKIIEDLGKEFEEYFFDNKKNRIKKSKLEKSSNFKIGDNVVVKGSYGMIVFGPYNDESKYDIYEIELEDGKMITDKDDGQAIMIHIEEKEDVEEDEFF